MIFASTFGDLHACRFVERTFRVDASALHQLERLHPLPDRLQRAVLKRQVEFLVGRVCAQHAVEALTGQKPASIPLQPDRAPAWPPGIVGAITHTAGYAAALVAQNTHYRGIGIDCEAIIMPENLNLQKHICVANELEALRAVHGHWRPEKLLTLIFSAKESLFKCLYPQVQAYFGFSAARVVRLDEAQHTFGIQLEQDLTPHLRRQSQWTGPFTCRQRLLMTAILYPGTQQTD
jgi:enterobactin synthetase component D